MIRVGILGAGIGAEHLAAYRLLPDRFQVRWLCDLDAARAAQVAGPDGPSVTTDTAQVLADAEVDLIDICLPPHLHVPLTLQALAAGKHVICEKPLATSLAKVAEVERAAEAAGCQVFPVFQYRFGPGLAKLRHLIDQGLTGRPLVAASETHWNRGAAYYAVPWRGTWAGEAGGAILGHAIHAHDLLCHLFGPVRQVQASLTTRVNPIETEDCAAIALTHACGALSTSSVTLGAAPDESRLRLVFDRLTATSGTSAYAPAAGSWTFTAREPADQPMIDTTLTTAPDQALGFAGFLKALADHLSGQGDQAISLADGRASIELVAALYASHRRGQAITLPLPADDPLFQGWQPPGPTP